MNAQFFRTIGKPAAFFTLLVLLVLLASAAPATTFAAPKVTINETFRNGTASGWNLIGNAILTSGGVDPAGSGWLRLTSAANNQAGSAVYNTAFSSADGMRATFTYATYGGSGADGFSFYLIDGATAVPTVGTPGGALGYSRGSGAPLTPGVTNGYVGIGFDEYGNFSNTGSGDCNPSCAGFQPNSVTIRGSGNLNTGFNYLTRAGTTIATGSRAGAKRARITISAGATKYITVEIDSGSGFQTIINNFNLSTAVGQAAMPATFKMGFSSSTGGSTNYHEIRDLTVGGSQPSTTTPVCAPNPSTVGQSVTCTATVTGSAGTPTGTVDFYDGSTFLGTGTLNGTGQATYTTSAFALGAHTINANYGGDGTYGVSSGSTVQQVNVLLTTTTTLTSSPNPSTAGQCVTLSATVTGNQTTSPAKVNAPKQTGTVTFYEGALSLGQCTLNGGTCSIQVCNLSVGTHNLTAQYSGDTQYSGSTSAVRAHIVHAAAPAEVPEADTLLLMSGGLGGVGVWLRYQWARRKKAK